MSHGYDDVQVLLPASLMKVTVIATIVGMVPHTHHLGVSGSFLKGYFRVEVSHALKDFLHYISAHNKSHSICNVAYGWSKSTPYCFQFSYNCSPICHE